MNSRSRKQNIGRFVFFHFFAALLGTSFSFAASDPKELVSRMDQVLRGNSHQMTVLMQVHTPRWKREYKIQVWMNGIDDAFARVIEPPKVAGQGFLRIQSRLWNYLPNAERTMLIPPSLLLDRFLGSDFSNDDFVKLSYFPRDYDSRIAEETDYQGTPAYHLELIPHPDAPVTYGKLEIWLRKEDNAPLKWNFYDDKMRLIRVLEYSEFRSFGNHQVPSVWTMSNLEKKDHETVIRILDAQYDVEVDPKIFTKENMEKFP